MPDQRFWLVGTSGRVKVITDQAEAASLASDGTYRSDGPFVPERELQSAVQLLRDVAASGVTWDEPRVSYVEVQIDRAAWDALAAYRGEEQT